uniref:40S ribosomal protein S3a n=1 Tax=Rhabditophanes sp. KR3021 TaxID=114890 RepID=A0AC35TY51_9BILA
MAVGKNKKMGKKGSKKKIVDPFTRKEWYDVKAPSMFTTRQVGKTFINKTQGTRIASEGLKGRVFEVSLGDLNNTDADFRKFKLIAEDVQGRSVLTNFHGMSFTRDKLCSIVKKWHTLIQANVAVKTSDGYVLRFFAIGFTKRAPRQLKKTTYAQSSQVRAIRARMIEIIQKEVGNATLKDAVNKLIPDSIGKDMEKACSLIYPLQDVYIRKVKILKKPKFEHSRLVDMHGDIGAYTTAEGVVVEKPDAYEPPVQESV